MWTVTAVLVNPSIFLVTRENVFAPTTSDTGALQVVEAEAGSTTTSFISTAVPAGFVPESVCEEEVVGEVGEETVGGAGGVGADVTERVMALVV